MGKGEWAAPESPEPGSRRSNWVFDLTGDPPRISLLGDLLAKKAQLPADINFLETTGVRPDLLKKAAAIARRKAMPASEVMIARGWISRTAYIRQLAKVTGAQVFGDIENPGQVIVPRAQVSAIAAPAVGVFAFPDALHLKSGDITRLVVSPEQTGAARLISMFAKGSERTRSVLIATGAQLRQMWFSALRTRMSLQATSYLAKHRPEFSAARRLTAKQALFLLAMGAGACAALASAPVQALAFLTCFFSVFYLASVIFRGCLIAYIDARPMPLKPNDRKRRYDPEDFPSYSILIPLYREAGQVTELIDSIANLDWPVERREVFLICEADDQETINAVEEHELPAGFHHIICPVSNPRTKPKALNFALALCSGEFTVIYDAEDRPSADQLREAWRKFARSESDLACVQAPLLIHNDRQNWLSAMFSLEYETLFSGILPALALLGGPLPLGGTSNHFRTAALKAAGGWDPHNVTEDADLGIRLARLGHRCGTIESPTWEEAPPVLNIWVKQRTRWIKGWLQTILVHTRNPIRTARELGWRGNLIFHLVLTSIVISILVHPIFLVQAVFLLLDLADGMRLDRWGAAMLWVSIFNLVGGYTTYGFLAYGVMKQNGRNRVSPWLLCFLPLYWLLISYSGWRAIIQLARNPFHWEKTTHGLANNHANAELPR